MRISDLSRLTGVSIRSLRYYEEKGLLAPSRTDSGYRVYAEEDVERVRQIQFYLHMGVRAEELARLCQQCAGFPGYGDPACAEEAIAYYHSCRKTPYFSSGILGTLLCIPSGGAKSKPKKSSLIG